MCVCVCVCDDDVGGRDAARVSSVCIKLASVLCVSQRFALTPLGLSQNLFGLLGFFWNKQKSGSDACPPCSFFESLFGLLSKKKKLLFFVTWGHQCVESHESSRPTTIFYACVVVVALVGVSTSHNINRAA